MDRVVFSDWTAEHGQNLELATVVARHRIHESGLFTDEKLIQLIEGHPRDQMRINTADPNHSEPEWRDGDLSGLSGEQILDSVKNGRLWLDIGNLSAHYPAFKALTSQLFAEIAYSKPDFAPIKPVDDLLVSSPNTVVSFHADPNPVMLLQCRGRKRLWTYPASDEKVLAREHLERIITRQWEGWEIPYRTENEQHSVAYDLGPGDFNSWAHNSPHRVVNYDELNVAITISYMTRRSRRKTAIYRANAFLRQKLGMTPKSTKTEGLIPLLKILGIVALRHTGIFDFDLYKPVATFRVDPQSTNGIREVRI